MLELSTVSLIPKEVTDLLSNLFGIRFYDLNELEQMIVTTAAIEGWVNHERACQLTSKHSRDVTLALPRLVDKGFLVADGIKKDKSYSLPGMEPLSPEDIFTNTLTTLDNLTHSDTSLTHSELNLTHSGLNSKAETCDERDVEGRFISDKLNKPFVDELDALTEKFRIELNALGAQAREHKRLDVDTMKQLINELCKGHYISVSVLEVLLDRRAQSLRQYYLKPMISDGVLQMAFPHKPNSPLQGYSTVD
ncbi:Fic family protein [Psychromonas algicola]|uniref:Fic family protein n=1 Tax=Psychromonas algicola TaxID=2555642 RepID=UPI001FBAA959|nr:hypothetical protein [Psychromonas sp. RZ5]